MIDFNENYQRENFQYFLKEFLPKDYIQTENELKIDKNNKYFCKATLLGRVKSLDDLIIIEVERIKSEKSRIIITKQLFKLLELYGYSKSLIITHSDKENHYRFSLITSELKWTSESKVKKIFSNPKRLSFLLGENSRIHTATSNLIKKDRVKDFSDLFQRFDIELVNDEFYEKYKNLFFDLAKKLEKDKEFSTFAKEINLEIKHFAKKLLGQIIFCYFLQKKGWLGIKKNKQFGSGDLSFLRNQFEKLGNDKNFFNEFLEYFFYEGLNKQNNDNYVHSIGCRVPYIGGGLFEYHEGYDWRKEDLNIPNSTFSNPEKSGILDVFDLYNFTVDENETVDVEISIDPEMLGRIFESLLDENLRLKRGAFYTPRTIVKEMCEESLINHLSLKLKNDLNYNDIFNFIKYSEISEVDNKIIKNAKLVDDTLEKIKICDPAIGSGAFAVGFVNLISKLRNTIKNYIERKYKNSVYHFKRECIQNAIYGVDIDSSAVEIAKLRLWLSLIVDDADYSSTEPLPYLDYKIMQGDSLIDEFYGYKFSINKNEKKQYSLDENPREIEDLINKLNNVQKEYMNLKQFTKRSEAKQKINKILLKIFKTITSHVPVLDTNTKHKSDNFTKNDYVLGHNRDFFCFELFFADVFYVRKGFDIIIANPPYEVLDSNEVSASRIAQLRKNYIFNPAKEGQLNYFKLFLAKFLTHLNDNGVSAFIFQNSFLGDKTCTKIRKFVFDDNRLLSLSSFPERDDANKRVFKSAKMSVCIAHTSKMIESNYKFKLEVWKDRNKDEGFKTSFDKAFIKKDPYYRIPCIDKFGLSIYFKMLQNSNVLKLSDIAKVYSGELDMTIHKKFFCEKKDNVFSSTILKGANIQRYCVTKETSQGKQEYLNKEAFLRVNKSARSSSYSEERIAMQGITGVNEKYRIKSCLVGKNYFLANSTNFLIKLNPSFSNQELITYLNSKLINWFFRIFSTNSNVNTYEINILPLIIFSKENKKKIADEFEKLIGNYDESSDYNLNNIIYETFGLNNQEIKYIDSFF